MQLAPGTDLKVMLVKDKQGKWHVCLRTQDGNLESWSEQVFETREDAQRTVDAWLGQLGAAGVRFQRAN